MQGHDQLYRMACRLCHHNIWVKVLSKAIGTGVRPSHTRHLHAMSYRRDSKSIHKLLQINCGRYELSGVNIWSGTTRLEDGIDTPKLTGLGSGSSVRNINIVTPALKQKTMNCRQVRQDALDIFYTSVNAVYPPQMISNSMVVSKDGCNLSIEGRYYEMNNNVYVVGFGKAVLGMARAVEDLIGRHIVRGVVSVPHGSQALFKSIGKDDLCVQDDSKIEVFEGAKDNLPDERSHAAALAIQNLAENLSQDDILIVLISGGGSSLLPTPVPPISLQDELDLTRILSTHGASIQQLNFLRQNVETLKGGGLAKVAKPASVISLVLSDVIDDKLDIISSGPTVPLLSSPRQCLQILERLKIKEKVPSTVLNTLQQKASVKKATQESSPHLHQVGSYISEWDHVQNMIIGSNAIATKAAFEKACDIGYVPLILTNTLQGEAKVAANMFCELAKYIIYGFGDRPPDQGQIKLSLAEVELTKHGISKMDLKRVGLAGSQAYNSKKGLCIICGGETIVNVTGTGKGGRNQEMALAFALQYAEFVTEDTRKLLSKYHVEFLSAGTDGQDGPTDAAGAVVNRYLVPMAITSKLKAADYLDNNDSYTLFKSLQDSDCLIQSGLTGTNVMDIQVLIIKPMS